MNVLYLTRRDWANVGYRYARALETLPGHNAKSVTYGKLRLDYPVDVLAPTNDKLARLIRWADVVHVFDDWPRFREVVAGKPLVVTYNGTYYRNHHGVANQKDKVRGAYQTCTTLDLTVYGPRWLPVPVSIEGPSRFGKPDGRLGWRVSHAPTNRAVKGTQYVIDAALKMPHVRFDIIENVTNSECIRRKSLSHIYIDQFNLGYGVNALEAWSMGIPVLANANKPIIDLMKSKFCGLPFVRTNPNKICEVLTVLMDNSTVYDKAVEKGMSFWMKYHSPDKVAKMLEAIYAKVA